MAWFLSSNYWSSLHHDLMSCIREKDISILAGNLNSGHSYLIIAVRQIRLWQSDFSPKCLACKMFGTGNFLSEFYQGEEILKEDFEQTPSAFVVLLIYAEVTKIQNLISFSDIL